MKLPTLDTNWYVLRARVRSEAQAADELRQGGYQTYLPWRRVRVSIRRYGPAKETTKPAMPGYLFLAEEKYKPIEWGLLRDELKFPHVGRPICGQYGPLRIPAKLVVKINEEEIAGLYDETGATKKANREKLAKKFAKGLPFRINDGPFWGHTVLSEGITPHDRIAGLVNILGRLAKIEFDPGQLEAA